MFKKDKNTQNMFAARCSKDYFSIFITQIQLIYIHSRMKSMFCFCPNMNLFRYFFAAKKKENVRKFIAIQYKYGRVEYETQYSICFISKAPLHM